MWTRKIVLALEMKYCLDFHCIYVAIKFYLDFHGNHMAIATTADVGCIFPRCRTCPIPHPLLHFPVWLACSHSSVSSAENLTPSDDCACARKPAGSTPGASVEPAVSGDCLSHTWLLGHCTRHPLADFHETCRCCCCCSVSLNCWQLSLLLSLRTLWCGQRYSYRPCQTPWQNGWVVPYVISFHCRSCIPPFPLTKDVAVRKTGNDSAGPGSSKPD